MTTAARGIQGATLAVCVMLTSPVHAQNAEDYCKDAFDFSLGPALVPASGWKQLGAKASLDMCRTRHVSRDESAKPADKPKGFPYSYSIHVQGQYFGVDREVRLPDATAVKGGAALSISLSRAPTKASADLDPNLLATYDGGGFDVGFVDLGVTSGYEASADRLQQNFTLGGEFRYGLLKMGLGRIVPSLVVRYERVDPTKSSATSGVPLNSGVHWRTSALAYWRAPLALNGRLVLQGDVQAFRARGLEPDLVAAGWRSGVEGAGTLSFAAETQSKRFVRLNSIYVRYAEGKQPTAAENRDALTAGVDIGIGR